MRSGVVARKIGMTRVYLDTGENVPVTVVHLDGCHVVSRRTEEKDGYSAVQVGSGRVKPVRLTKAQRGHFARNEVSPRSKIVEFRVDDPSSIPVGAEIKADHFVPGQYVDVAGFSLGKGFAGGMKRWNFRGLRASHGVSVSHRSIGSTGGRQDPGRTFKNKKMPGHLGAERVTVISLEVLRVDAVRGLIWIKGALPGFKGGWLRIRDAVKKKLPQSAPIPGSFHVPNEQKAEA